MSGKTVSMMAQHESWISLDPIQGCPAGCAYCYLGPKGLFKKIPFVLEDAPEVIYRQLREYRFFEKLKFADIPPGRSYPICIGNYTDMCLTSKNREFLISLLREHKRSIPEVPVCVVTKAALSREFLETVNQLDLQIIFFLSISFLPVEFEKGTQPTKSRLKNFELISEFEKVHAIHFWRPITSINIPDHSAVQKQIKSLQNVGAVASVITGLKFGDNLSDVFNSNPDNPLHEYYKIEIKKSQTKNEIFEPKLREDILNTAKELAYPVFLHTSCAVSYVLNKPDYNATFRKLHLETKCMSSTCPPLQRNLCSRFKDSYASPSETLLKQVADFLGLPYSAISFSEDLESIIIRGELTQEEQSFLTQATSFPVRGEVLVPNLEWIGSIHR